MIWFINEFHAAKTVFSTLLVLVSFLGNMESESLPTSNLSVFALRDLF